MGMFIRFLLAFILGVILMCVMRIAAEAAER